MDLQFFGGRGGKSNKNAVTTFKLNFTVGEITENDKKVADIIRNAPVGTEIQSIWHWNSKDEIDVYRVVNQSGERVLQHISARNKDKSLKLPLWLNTDKSSYSYTSDFRILDRINGTEVKIIKKKK
ncbi:MAG: hypothetical protein IJQ99_03790 [Synergistaceae bacterium]|nr:hypothetical protein [Synergistaceae bacterium]